MLRFALLLFLALSGACASRTPRPRGFSGAGAAAAAGGGTTTTHVSSTQHVQSSSSCSATATADSYTEVQNAHKTAVAAALKVGCGGSPWTVAEMTQKYTAEAVAFAQAITSAATQCTTTGNAVGCAFAKGKAKAIATAHAEAHAAAVAAAQNVCLWCWKSSTALTSTFGKASAYADLIAEAESKSIAKVCSTGTNSVSAEAFKDCYGLAIANVLAEATAKAVVAGGCGHPMTAQALTTAIASIDIENDAKCVALQSPSSPGAYSNTDGKSDANAVTSP